MTSPSAADVKLLPCPFCGSSKLCIEVETLKPDNYKSGHVKCDDCETQGPEPDEWLPNSELVRFEVAKKWNTRTTPPSQEALVKALEEVRAAIVEAPIDIVTDTLWIPERLSPNETAIDCIDAALAAARAG